MYGFDETTSASKYLEAGQQEHVTLDAIKFEPLTEGGTKVLTFNFSRGGSTFRHVEFPIDKDREAQYALNEGKNPEDRIKASEQAQGERFKHIIASFMKVSDLKIKAESWEDFCNQLIKATQDKYTGKEFKLKLILNNKDYVCFPKRAIKPFVVPQGSPVNFVFDPKWDRIEPKIPEGDNEEFDEGNSTNVNDFAF